MLDLAVMVAAGGDCLADAAMLRAEPELFGPVASGPVISRLITALAGDAAPVLKAIRGARAAARQRAWQLAGPAAPGADGGLVTVDLDATRVPLRLPLTLVRQAAIDAGTWQPRTDGTAARAHIARLRAAGATTPEIAAAAGLARATVAAVEAGDGDVMAATAAAILAAGPAAVDPRRCDAGGTRLRLQALAVMGHTPTRTARAAGLNPAYLREVAAGRVPEVSRQVRRAVAEVYGAWWDKTPAGDTAPARRAIAAARNRAERERWVAPAGLDDDRLDEPGYRPAPRRWVQPEGHGIAPELDMEAGA